MQEIEIVKGAEEFRLGSGPVGALLVHGFTGSPYSMRGLGEHLAANGLSVEGVRLPGHATTWQDLNTKTASDWQRAVDEAFTRFSAEHDKTYIVALSFGATLALDFAARHPDRVDGMVLIAPFLRSPDPLAFLLPVLGRVLPWFKAVSNDIAQPGQDEKAYTRLPLRAAVHVTELTKRVRDELPKVTVPTLVLHSRNDHTAAPDGAQFLFDRISSEDKELIWYDRSYHVITLDYDRDDVFARTLRFITERAGRG